MHATLPGYVLNFYLFCAQAPKEFFRKEDEQIWTAGYNEFGQLNHGNNVDTAALVLCQKKQLAKYDLKNRIQMVACGWYHTVLVARQRWTTGKPVEFNKDALKDEEILTTEEVLSYCLLVCARRSPDDRLFRHIADDPLDDGILQGLSTVCGVRLPLWL